MNKIDSNLHLLIVSKGFAPWGGPIATRATRLAKQALARDWKVTVLCTKDDCAHVFEDRPSLDSVRSASRIQASDGTDYFGRDAMQRFIGFSGTRLVDKLLGSGAKKWKRNCLALVSQTIRPDEVDLIFSSSPTQMASEIAKFLATSWKTPWIADFRDPPWESMLSLERLGEIIKVADKTVLNTPRAADYVREQFPEFDSKVECHTNGIDERDQKVSLSPQTVPNSIVYAGGIYPCIEPVMSWLKNAGLAVHAYGFQESKRRGVVRGLIEDGIEFHLPIPSEEVVVETSIYQSMLVHFPATYKYRISAKTYLSIATGRPVLLSGECGGAMELLDGVPGVIDLNPFIQGIKNRNELLDRIYTYDVETGSAERREFLQSFTWQSIFEGIFDKYIR